MFSVLHKDNPEAWFKESDNKSKLEFSVLNDEDSGEPTKKLTLQPRQAKAWQGKGIYSPIPPWHLEVSLLFPVKFQSSGPHPNP